MCLLRIGLDTLGLLLRIWLWISVPMAVIILMVATYFNYLRHGKQNELLTLAVEGWGGEAAPEEPYIGKGDVVGEGKLAGERKDMRGGKMDGEDEGAREGSVGLGEENEETRADRGAEPELGATGKETIYRGLLWMKEKYEEYRQQTDRRYEQLRDELGRSEGRYQELLAVTQQGGEAHVELGAKQAIIDELEAQLKSERMKVEELVMKLQANSELLLKICQEMENAPDLGKETGRISL